MSLIAPREGPALLLLGVVLVAGCGGASLEPSASVTANATASLQPLTREEAIAAAGPFAGAPPSAVVVRTEAGPFGQFDPDRNARSRFRRPTSGSGSSSSVILARSGSAVIIDYVTGALVETIKGITN